MYKKTNNMIFTLDLNIVFYWFLGMQVFFVTWIDAQTVITVVRAPDDGCQHPKHVELPTEI